MKRKTIVLNLLLILSLCITSSVQAENQALMELLKALYENGTIDEQTYDLVKNVAQSNVEKERNKEKKIAQKITQKDTRHDRSKLDKRKHDEHKKASKNNIKIGGRVQIDGVTYSEDESRQNDGTEIRRARLFAQANLGNAWGYKLQYDFTDDGIDGIQDAYLDFKGLKNYKIRVGHFREPFSLQSMTSSKYVLFTERALPHVFSEGRNLGLQFSSNDQNWSAAVGLYSDNRDGVAGDNDEGFGVSGRVTYAPIYKKSQALHLGTSVAYRSTGSISSLRFRERSESHISNTRLLDTGIFDADSYTSFVGEAAYIYGSFHIQGEYYHTSVYRDITVNPDLNFSGFYVEGGWFLTGESMNYKASKGSFSHISPKGIVGRGGVGAWQVALRFSSLDLADEDIIGGEEDNFTIGLNWYATPSIRFIANYVNVLDVKGGAFDGDEPAAFQIRTQLEF